jgi:Phycobilisome degradation protein nblA
MDLPIELSLEQQFNLRAYADQVKGLDQEQAQQMLLQVLRQLMIKENVIKYLVKQQIESDLVAYSP